MQNLILIDGQNVLYRCFYAVKKSKFTDKNARNYNQLLDGHIFLKQLVSCITMFSKNGPCPVILFWDSAIKSKFRLAISPSYKAHRKKADDEAVKNQGICRAALGDVLKHLGICQLVVPGVEADDLIAYFYRQFKTEYNIVILSNDSDMKQFPDTIVCDSAIKTVEVTKELAKQNLLKKIVCGDKSDNIPGVRGVGEVTFTKEYKGLSYHQILAKHESDIEILDRIITNRMLCSLLFSNQEIIRAPELELLKVHVRRFFKEVEFNKLMAAAVMSKYNLVELQKVMPIFKDNYKVTRELLKVLWGKWKQQAEREKDIPL